MNIRELFFRYFNNKVTQVTLNPKGPGAVRIHLIPPKFGFDNSQPSIVILNGYYYVPLNHSWAILLQVFLGHLESHEGKELSDDELKGILNATVRSMKKLYPNTSAQTFENDLNIMVNAFMDIAYGKEPKISIGELTVREYAPNMTAPHRMDLMISAMVKDGKWHCNQKCVHCYAAGQFEAEKSELRTDEWKKAIDICRKVGISQITFTGGEPTLRDDLFELIKYSEWFVTRLNTNGQLLTEEYCQNLKEAQLDSMQVTLYSSNAEIHDSLVGCSGGFGKTLQGIKNAVDAGLDVSINTPLCSMNKEYVTLLKLASECGVKYFSCSGLICTGNATKEFSKSTQLTETELYEILKEAQEFCVENKLQLNFTSPGWMDSERLSELRLNIPECGACLSNMAIAPDGTVVPCQSWLNQSNLGNILTTPWKKIWNNQKCKEIRNMDSTAALRCPLRK